MTKPSRELFDDYAGHYGRGGEAQFRPAADVDALHLERLPRWLHRVPNSARILDAGCANGYLLGLLQHRGYTHLTGVDVSAQLADIARAALGGSVPVHTAEVQNFLAQSAGASYDVILFHHVIEHIPREQTVALLREFRRCLSPDGYLGIKTPNANCLMAGYHGFGDFTHVVLFNERSLTQVLEAAGFSAAAVEFPVRPPRLFFSLRHPLRMIMRVLNRLRWQLNRALHQSVCVLLDLRPMPRVFDWELEVVARK